MSTILSAAVSLASVVIIGNLLILAHELGHYRAPLRHRLWTGPRTIHQRGGYAAQPPLARMAIIAPGLLTNLPAAFLVFAGLLGIQGRLAFLPVTTAVVAHSTAEAAGFQTGDRIVAAQGKPVHVFDDIRPALLASAGRTLHLEAPSEVDPA